MNTNTKVTSVNKMGQTTVTVYKAVPDGTYGIAAVTAASDHKIVVERGALDPQGAFQSSNPSIYPKYDTTGGDNPGIIFDNTFPPVSNWSLKGSHFEWTVMTPPTSSPPYIRAQLRKRNAFFVYVPEAAAVSPAP